MTGALTPRSAALQDLIDALVAIGEDDSCDGNDWIHAVIKTFAQTPFLENLDPYLYEMLLSWAAFDLNEAKSLRAAGFVTAMLLHRGYLTFVDVPDGELCAVVGLATGNEFDFQRICTLDIGDRSDGVSWHEIADERAAEYLRDWPTEPGEQTPEAA